MLKSRSSEVLQVNYKYKDLKGYAWLSPGILPPNVQDRHTTPKGILEF